MARLPVPGSDDGVWGSVLNDYLGVAHNTDGTLKDISQAQVIGLSADLSSKATSSSVVHKAGAETITGAKDFTGGLTVNGTTVALSTDSQFGSAGISVTSPPYNADPTGASDSTAAFQAALSAGDIVIPTGTYRVGYISHTGSSRSITALGPVTIVQTDANGVFDLRGGWDTLGTISSYSTVTADLVTPGESNPLSSRSRVTQLTTASAVTVSVGDVVKVVSDDQVPTGKTVNERRGEYALIGVAATSSTTITLGNILIETYTTNPRLARLRDIRFVVTGNITFDTDPAIRNTTTWGAVILLRAAQNCLIEGIEFRNSLGRAIGNFTYGSIILNCKFRNLANRPSLSHFGYGVQDGGWMLRMQSCWGENLRHLYSEGSNTVSAGSSSYEYFGGGWFAHVSDCVGQNCQAQVFDTHGTAYGVTFSSCKAIGSFTGAASGGSGFSLRGRKNHLKDCYAYGCEIGFNVSSADTLLEHCVARKIKFQALSLVGDNNDAVTVTTVAGLRVVGGEFETEGSFYVAVIGMAGYTVKASLENIRLRSLTPNNGATILRTYGTTVLRGENITVDMQDVSNAVPLSFLRCEGSTTARIRRSTHLGGSAAYTGYALCSANTDATASDVELSEIEYEHASLNATWPQSGTAIARYKHSYKSTFGTAWWQMTSSASVSITAAASVALDVLKVPLDPIIYVTFTGSNGAVTVGALPTPVSTNTTQRILMFNSSNGDITIPNSLGVITAGASAEFLNVSGVWKRLT